MIVIDLTKVLKEKGITSKELAELIGITEANLSILRSGKAKAIRFSTLNAICKALNCEVGDFIRYEDGDNFEED